MLLLFCYLVSTAACRDMDYLENVIHLNMLNACCIEAMCVIQLPLSLRRWQGMCILEFSDCQ